MTLRTERAKEPREPERPQEPQIDGRPQEHQEPRMNDRPQEHQEPRMNDRSQETRIYDGSQELRGPGKPLGSQEYERPREPHMNGRSQETQIHGRPQGPRMNDRSQEHQEPRMNDRSQETRIYDGSQELRGPGKPLGSQESEMPHESPGSQKPVVVSTTFIADIKMRLAFAAAALIAIYYRLPIPFFLLALILSYLMWSYYWTLMSSKSTVAKSRVSHNRIFVGETFTWTLKCQNNWFLPLVRCGIHVFMPEKLTFSSSVPLSSTVLAGGTGADSTLDRVYPVWNSCNLTYAWLAEKKDLFLELQVTARQRGVYYIPPAHFFVGDPSGFYRGMNEMVKEEYLYVLPRLLGTQELMESKVFVDSMRDANFGLEDRYQVLGVRDYQITDPLKSINWYASARTGSLKTNLYQSKDSEYCMVVFDASVAYQPFFDSTVEYGEDPLLESAISLAAGIALHHLEQGAKTAFFTNAPLLDWVVGDSPVSGSRNAYMKRVRTISSLDYDEGEEQAQRILELCSAIDGENRANLDEQRILWAKIQRNLRPGTLVYLLGYHAPPPSWEERVSQGEVILDPATFYGPERIGSLSTTKVRHLDLTKEVKAN